VNTKGRAILRALSQVQAPHCPTLDALGAYLQEQESAADRHAIEAHIQACPSCLHHLIDLQEAVFLARAGDSPAPELVQRVQAFVPDPESLHVSGQATVSRVTEPVRLEQQRAHRRRFAWMECFRTPVWGPALAASLLLSLTVNAWLGYRALTQPSPLELLTTRGATETTQALAQGDRYAATGAYAQALEAYAAFLRAQRGPVVPVLHKMAVAHARLGHWQPVIDVTTAALVLAPQDAVAYRYRGTAYEALGDRPQALRDWQRAAQLGDAEAQQLLRTLGVTW